MVTSQPGRAASLYTRSSPSCQTVSQTSWNRSAALSPLTQAARVPGRNPALPRLGGHPLLPRRDAPPDELALELAAPITVPPSARISLHADSLTRYKLANVAQRARLGQTRRPRVEGRALRPPRSRPRHLLRRTLRRLSRV